MKMSGIKSSISKMTYYAETDCQATKANGAKCTNKAYYLYNSLYTCGVHGKKDKRIQLPKNPDAKANILQRLIDEKAVIEKAAVTNSNNGLRGEIVCSKLRMMKPAEEIPGFLKVFPNFKHQTRVDGFGCSSLSPMSLGPVEH